MPESAPPPADGTTGTPEGTPQTPPATADPKAGDTNPATGKTFTQDELNAIVSDRVARAKPADYDEAKAALDRENARKEGEKTDLEKARESEAARKAERDTARADLTRTLRMSEIRIEALKQGADEELVIALLADDTSITVSEGKVLGAKEAVEQLIERKPNLTTGGTRRSGAEFGGIDQPTIAEQIAALEGKTDKESRRQLMALKVSQGLSIT